MNIITLFVQNLGYRLIEWRQRPSYVYVERIFARLENL